MDGNFPSHASIIVEFAAAAVEVSVERAQSRIR